MHSTRVPVRCALWVILLLGIASPLWAAGPNFLPNGGFEDGVIRMVFNISYKDRMVLQDSPLGLIFTDQPPMDRDFRMYHLERTRHLVNFPQSLGKNDSVHCEYNQAIFYLQEKNPPFRLLEIEFRVSDGGMAFRYRIPAQPGFGDFSKC